MGKTVLSNSHKKRGSKSLAAYWVYFPLILVSVGVYWNALNNDFIWDDFSLIVENRYIQELNFQTLWSFFSDKTVYNHAEGHIYRPFYILSFALNYKLSGLAPWGYHLTNIILHTLNSLLLFFVFSAHSNRIESTPDPDPSYLFPASAFIAALLFAIHPVHTESVTWIKGRDDIMALFFMLTTLYFYTKSTIVREVNPRGARLTLGYYLCSLISFFCALFSKEMAVTLPLILISYDISFSTEKKVTARSAVRYLPFFALVCFYLVIRTLVLGQVGQTEEHWAGSLVPTLYTMARGMVRYINLLILPLEQSGDYMTFPISSSLDGPVLFSFLILFTLLIGSIGIYRVSKKTAFGICWFAITILPVTNILIPINISIAERFLYIPSAGFCLFSGVVFGRFLLKGHSASSLSKVLPIVTLIGITAFFLLATHSRNKVWRDNGSFWTDVVKSFPDNYRARYNLGFVYEKKGLLSEAADEYKKALEINHDLPEAHFHLGLAYHEQGRVDEAIAGYRKAIKLEPDHAEAHNNLGNAYASKGLTDQAIEAYRTTLKLNPDLADAHYNLGRVYKSKGLKDEAIMEFKKVLLLNPQDREARKEVQILSGRFKTYRRLNENF